MKGSELQCVILFNEFFPFTDYFGGYVVLFH